MPDLSAGFDIPNPYGLQASDFDHDIDGYRAALGFLGDLQGGSDHNEALTNNGGAGLLTRWQKSPKFRRVYAKCKRAGDAERAYVAAKATETAPNATEGEGQGNVSPSEPGPQMTSYRLGAGMENLPRPGIFSGSPRSGSWGG